MHIILGILGAIVTILVLIKRLSDAGFDIGWLNPVAWKRRRNWRNQYEGNPIFSLDDPLEVAAILATAIAKIDGDISKEEKAILLSLFQSEFGKTEKQAADLLMSSVFIFADGVDAIAKPEKIMQRSLEKFSEEQARSVIKLLEAILNSDSANKTAKELYLQRVVSIFDTHFNNNQKW